ncbi:MAG: FlgD immunoglobulin-like domain containing protein [candidate division WOR-3 bacterium]
MKWTVLSLFLCSLAFAGQVGIEPVVMTGPEGNQLTYFRINTGSEILNPEGMPPLEPPAAPADTGVLWVDRNHRYGICQSAAISADGHHIFANWYLNSPRADYYRTLGNEVPLWESFGDFFWAYGGQQIGVSRDGSVLTLARQDGAVKWSSSSSYPDWVFPYNSPMTGYSRCSRNGNRVVTCQNGVLTVLRSSNGQVLWSAEVPEPSRLQGIDLSDNGQIVAVTLYDSCIVYEQGARRAAIPIGTTNCGTQYAAALSGDGRLLVTGDYYGYVKLYYWDSTAANYLLRWQAQVGTPWVTGVAISRDGSRIACGTGYANGKLCVFDSSSSTPVMVYQNYGATGAQIASVALSADGSRVATASWGDIATSGTFRVFTVHNVGDTTPLVAITRDDEPGSLFCCDISDDGQFAVAGGKAVHAQRMGNGGEVYAVMIGAAESSNVGVSAILAPGRYLQVGQQTNVAWRVTNYGDAAATFWTHCQIRNSANTLLRHDSILVTALPPQETVSVSAPLFTPDTYDLYRFICYTLLPQDQYPADDTMIAIAKCYHDVRPCLIRPPHAENTVNMPFAPRVSIANNGSYPDTARCLLIIADSAGNQVYAESLTTPLTLPDDTATLAFPQLSLAPVGTYTATAISRCRDDRYPRNDTLRLQFRCTYEIIYDDGQFEAFYWVGRRDNDKFYVRFTPTIPPPYSLRHCRIYTNMANTPFDYVMLCPGSGNKPDTLTPLHIEPNVIAPSAPGWAEFDLDVTRHDSQDIWVVIHWPDNSPAIGVGADATPPIDLRSYFSSNQDTFQLWTTHDWMVRLLQSPEVGIASDKTTEPLRFELAPPAPNPFSSITLLSYSLPQETKIELKVFDAAGRLVSVLFSGSVRPGRFRLAWRGKDSSGQPLPPGIYFLKLLAPDLGLSAMRKLVLTR